MLTIKNANKGRVAVFAGLLVLAAVSAGWGLSAESLNDHECFVSVTAREMLASGNWIEPTYNGQPRLQKTPLSYWLVAGLGKITGKIDELTARLPSAIFAVLSVAAIFYFANRWLSFRIAILSAAIWATSNGYIIYSHSARQDMVMTFFVLICFLSFYTAIATQSAKKLKAYMIIFWVSFGLANLAKGPEPIPLVLIPLFVYIAISRQWKKLPKLFPIWGVALFLVITLAWPIAVAYKANWDISIWKREFIDRFFGEYAKGNYPIYFYFKIMFKYVFPWAAFLPMALAAPFFRIWAEKQRVMLFLWIVFVADFAFLTISGGKRQQYLLSIMPALIILFGILLEDIAFERRAHTVRFAVNFLKGHIIATLAIVGFVLITVLWAGSRWQAVVVKTAIRSFSVCGTSAQLPVFIIALCAMAVVAAGVVAVMFAKHKPASGCATIFVSIVIFYMVCSVGIMPITDVNDCTREFALKIAGIVPQTDKIAASERMSAKFLNYTGRIIPQIADKEALYQDYENGDWVVDTGKFAEELVKDGRFRQVYYDSREEFSRGKWTGGALFHKSAPVIEDAK